MVEYQAKAGLSRSDLLEQALIVVAHAAAAKDIILEKIQTGTLFPQKKGDGSWVTSADLASHEYLLTALTQDNGLPVISEEAVPRFEFRKEWKDFWLIDPLDNTKGVVDGQPELSRINIMRFRNERPELSVVLNLHDGQALVAIQDLGVFHFNGSQLIPLSLPDKVTEGPLYTAYKGNIGAMAQATAQIYTELAVQDRQLVEKSSMAERFLAVMQGRAHVYIEPREISDWDVTPFLHACEILGCTVTSLRTGEPLQYNSAKLRLDPYIVIHPAFKNNSALSHLRLTA